MRRRDAIPVAIITVALVIIGVLSVIPPARGAVAGDVFYGHRCRTYATATNENTVRAMRQVSEAGVGCEIDVWQLPGCRPVVHDNTWTRVADPATLVGVPARVLDTTCEQVRQIRTKGGEPIPMLNGFTKAAGRAGVPLLIEVKNRLPASVLDHMHGVTASWYQSPSPGNCRLGTIDALAAAGATVGIKDHPDCPMTREQVAAHASFIADHLTNITPEAVTAYQQLGVRVMPMLVTRTGWERASAAGVRTFIVNHPRQAVTW